MQIQRRPACHHGRAEDQPVARRHVEVRGVPVEEGKGRVVVGLAHVGKAGGAPFSTEALRRERDYRDAVGAHQLHVRVSLPACSPASRLQKTKADLRVEFPPVNGVLDAGKEAP